MREHVLLRAAGWRGLQASQPVLQGLPACMHTVCQHCAQGTCLKALHYAMRHMSASAAGAIRHNQAAARHALNSAHQGSREASHEQSGCRREAACALLALVRCGVHLLLRRLQGAQPLEADGACQHGQRLTVLRLSLALLLLLFELQARHGG